MPGRLASTAWKDKAARGLGVVGTALLLAGRAAGAAGQVAPDADWRTLDTPHFSITYPAAMEELGRRAAVRAERARARLQTVLPELAPGRVELLLTDEVDFSNGFAAVRPARRVTIYLRPPVDGFALSNFDDWLDLVITHELAHVVHLDATGGLGGFLRRIFGRVPASWPFFPGLATPDWAIEGLATWYESELTGAGRVAGSYFRMMLRTAALAGELESIDAASGRSPEWPAGERSYLYGSLFFEYLLDRYGEDRMERFVDAVRSQWVPYRLDSAAEDAFGVTFSEAWRDWAAAVEAEAERTLQDLEAAGGITTPEVLTREARLALHPKVADDGSLAFSRADGRSDPQIRIQAPERGGGRGIRTNGAVPFDWLPDGDLLVAQPEFLGPYRIHRDLWRIGVDGEGRRLTRGKRLDQPSAAPGGEWAAAIQYRDGTSVPVRVDLDSGEVVPLAEPRTGEAWGFPAVSPDGRWIALSRWDGAGVDVVIVDARTGVVTTEVTADRALDLAPDWTAEGDTLVWASDWSGIPQIVAAEVDPGSGETGPVRQVTRLPSGAAFPAVDPAGRWLHFSLYTPGGWEVARIPWEPEDWTGPTRSSTAPRRQGTAARAPEPAVVEPTGPSRPYAALPSLRPRYWEPIVLAPVEAGGRPILDTFLGVETSASDLVGRHTVDLRLAFALGGGEMDASLGYLYAGLGNPLLSVTASQEWDGDGPFQVEGPSGEPPSTLYLLEREQRANLGVTVLRNRWRGSGRLGAAAGFVWESRRVLDEDLRESETFSLQRPDTRLAEGQLSLSLSTARSHALSVSREEGATLFLLGRARRDTSLPDSLSDLPGRDRSREELLARMNLYQSFSGPGFGDHVLALQVAGGAAWGPGADQLTWDVGGARGQAEPVSGLSLFGGSSLFFPVRGFPEGTRAGRLAWAASAEYRFPLFLVNRGPGLLPIHLDRVHGSVFGDAGNAWGPELGIPGYQQPRLETLASAGAELSLRLLLLYRVEVRLRVGMAAPFNAGHGLRWYLRLGPSF